MGERRYTSSPVSQPRLVGDGRGRLLTGDGDVPEMTSSPIERCNVMYLLDIKDNKKKM